jgi:hypothetical protein
VLVYYYVINQNERDKIGKSRLWWPASMAEKNVKIYMKRDATGRWRLG